MHSCNGDLAAVASIHLHVMSCLLLWERSMYLVLKRSMHVHKQQCCCIAWQLPYFDPTDLAFWPHPGCVVSASLFYSCNG